MATQNSRLTGKWMTPEDLTIVGIDLIDPAHPLDDPRATMALDEALVQSVMADGIIQPIIVKAQGPTTFVVAGRQRVRAAREAVETMTKANRRQVDPAAMLQWFLGEGECPITFAEAEAE